MYNPMKSLIEAVKQGPATNLQEGSMDKMSLQDLWMSYASADYATDQGWEDTGSGSPRLNKKKLEVIYKFVEKNFGKSVAKDMDAYGKASTYEAEYADEDESKEAKMLMKKLARKHGIKE